MRKVVTIILTCAVIVPRLLFGAPVPAEVKTVVAFVFAPAEKAGQLKPWGTSFFVGVADPNDEKRIFSYLVTAKHVLQTEDRKSWLSKIFLRLNTLKGFRVRRDSYRYFGQESDGVPTSQRFYG
jgi:hypothetical protein